MDKGFWEKLPKPFFLQAPLANVTDAAFRRLIARYGKPDAMFTEFVSADGLILGNREILGRDLIYTESERPIVAQFFTAKPEMMEKAASLAQALGFDGVDINMGCPDAAILRQGAGAALIKSPERARELIAAAKQGALGLPVSVKTRIGWNKNEIETWLPALLDAKPATITVHARTRKEMSAVGAHWDAVKRAVAIRNESGSDTYIVGNGDVTDLNSARVKAEETGADGVMIGRGIFGNPWRFNREKKIEDISLAERFDVMVEHTKLFAELLGDIKSFAIMKKHYKAYATGFDGAKELRAELMEAENALEVEQTVKAYLTALGRAG